MMDGSLPTPPPQTEHAAHSRARCPNCSCAACLESLGAPLDAASPAPPNDLPDANVMFTNLALHLKTVAERAWVVEKAVGAAIEIGSPARGSSFKWIQEIDRLSQELTCMTDLIAAAGPGLQWSEGTAPQALSTIEIMDALRPLVTSDTRKHAQRNETSSGDFDLF